MKHERRILCITGADRLRFLNDLITVEVKEDMALSYGALLTPQGKILTDLFIWPEWGSFCLDLPISEYDAIKARLNMYKLRADIALLDDEREVHQVKGAGDPRGAVGKRYYGDAPNDPISDLMGDPMDADEYLRLRINALIPEFGVDFGANEAYPIEWRFNEMNGIDYRKGCYVGQEIAARMRHKTELQKTVKRFRVEGDATLGDAIISGEREIGKLLSRAGDDALGFVRLKWLGDELRARGVKLSLNEL